MAYNGYRGGGGGGYRNGGGYSQQRRGNGGNRRGGYQAQNGGGEGYKANRATLRPNRDKQSDKHPDFKGVGNVEIDGHQHVLFFSLWFEQDEKGDKFSVSITPAEEQRQGRQQNGGYQQRGNGRGAYTQQMTEQYTREQFERPQNGGAMSRARPIQPAYYREEGPYENAPPPVSYPDGPEGDQIPF